MSNFFKELKNRNVYKVATAYAISAWLIIQVVDTVGDNLQWSGEIAAIITKILLVGFPIALVITWLYEFTPQGVMRTGSVQQDTIDNRKAGRRLNHIIIGSLAVTLCFVLVERVFFANRTSINDLQKASIAVLPFVNMSSEEENEYFADGLTEQILDELANLSGMQVTARTSSFKFKGKNEDIRAIAKQLTVNYILEGSVQYDGKRNRIKITTQLINASNGYHLWSETYEEDFKEVFDIQEDVGRKVASELRVQLLPGEEKTLITKLTENTEAYKLYIRSREYSQKRNDRDLDIGIDLLKQALELDPNFAEAHAELAFLYSQKHFYGNLSKENRDKYTKLHLTKALEIAPNKPEVLRANALKIMQERGDSSKVIADLRKAIKTKPNYADAYYMLSQALNWAKQPNLGLNSLEKAVELDPLNTFFAKMLAQRYFYNYKDHKSAFEILDNIIKNDPSDGAGRTKALMVAREPYGDLAQGFILIHEAGKKDPYLMGNLNYHSVLAMDLDLLPISEKYLNLSQMRYPDNENHTFLNVSFLYNLKGDNTSRKEWIDFWASEKGLDKKAEAIERADLNTKLGNYYKAIEILEKAIPALKKNDLNFESIDLWQIDDWIFYTELLRFIKENTKADKLAQEVCKYYQKKIIPDSLISVSRKNDLQLDCFYLSNDTLNFIKSLENRYFVKKDRMNIFPNMKSGWYKRFETHPGYKQLEKRITEETHRMRAEVIEYLKAEGDWDPAWDKELGLE